MEILIGRHVVIHITCSKVTCNPTEVAYFWKVYYHTSFENYVVYEAVIVTLPPQNGRLLAYCGIRGNRSIGSQVERGNIIHFVTL